MTFQNWRWWQWGIVSLIVGAAMGFAFSRGDVDDPSLPSTSIGEFIKKLSLKTDTGDSVVTWIRVSPPTRDQSQQLMQAVTFWEKLRRKNTGNLSPYASGGCTRPSRFFRERRARITAFSITSRNDKKTSPR